MLERDEHFVTDLRQEVYAPVLAKDAQQCLPAAVGAPVVAVGHTLDKIFAVERVAGALEDDLRAGAKRRIAVDRHLSG